MMGKCPCPHEGPVPPPTQNIFWCLLTAVVLFLHSKDQGTRGKSVPLDFSLSCGLRHKEEKLVFSLLSPLLASQQLLSYLRYLLYHKPPKGVFNPISEPCSLLREEKGAPKPPSSSLDATTEASPGRVGSTERGEAQCSSGKSTCREWDLEHSMLNQKHLKGCPLLWLCGEFRKSLLSWAEGSL